MPTNRKRVCIVTDLPSNKNVYEQVDSISDFIDGHLVDPSEHRQAHEHYGPLKVQLVPNDLNFYKDLTGSPTECQKPTPPGKSDA